VRAKKSPLPADVLEQLDEIATMVPFHKPYNFPWTREYKGSGHA
jgi:hypothetical protein